MIEEKSECLLPYQQQEAVRPPSCERNDCNWESCFIIFQMNNCNSFCFDGVDDSDGWSPSTCRRLGSTKDFSRKIYHFTINLFSLSTLEKRKEIRLTWWSPYTAYEFVAYQFLELRVRSDFTQDAMITLNHVKVMVPRVGNEFTRGIWQRDRILL